MIIEGIGERYQTPVQLWPSQQRLGYRRVPGMEGGTVEAALKVRTTWGGRLQ